jgi:hypothetical protein
MMDRLEVNQMQSLMVHMFFVVLVPFGFVRRWITLIMMIWLHGSMKGKQPKEGSTEDQKNWLMFAIRGGNIQHFA